MKRRLLVYIITGIMTSTFVFTILPEPSRAGPPAFYCWNNGPWEGWENEQIEFLGGGYGGWPPYWFKWDFDDGTIIDWTTQNPVYHAFTNLISSPVIFDVWMYAHDSGANPQYDDSNHLATIYKDYDIKAWINVWEVYLQGSRITFRPKAINDKPIVAPDIVNGLYTWTGICTLYKYNFGTEDWDDTGYFWSHNPNNPDGDIDPDDEYQWETWPAWFADELGRYKIELVIDSEHDTKMENNIHEDIFWVV